jgi:hypothetical protein
VNSNLPDPTGLSDEEFNDFIWELRLRIAANKAQLDPRQARRKHTLKIVRGTVLTVGGLVGATLDWLAGILTVVGAWDWVDALAEDARITNRQLELQRDLTVLENQLTAAAAEFQRRTDLTQPGDT